MIGEVFVKEGQTIKKGDKIASISESFINDKLTELN
ncbi:MULTISPECIES: biotin/lipoyl-binding protein [unclassified Clostridium]|nr:MULTISPECIES: biotin/lipoyl-binding protein [unclassified Clostridium]